MGKSHCLIFAAVLLLPGSVLADGGTMRFSRQAGNYRIALFTFPTSLRAGVVDFSVLVQSVDSNKTLLDVPVMVYVHPENDPQQRRGGPATTSAATNKLFHAISLDLAEPGRWHVEVEVQGSRVETVVEVAAPLPSWMDLGLWITWPAAAILLFVLHQYLVRAGTNKAR